MAVIKLWDTENTPNIIAKFDLYPQYSQPDSILQERVMICSAWGDLGGDYVEWAAGLRFKGKKPDDRLVVKDTMEGIRDADLLIAHNHDKFDIRMLNARAVYHGFKPLPPIRSIDTLKVARKYFKFNSNRLDYLGEYFGVGRKIHTSFQLWLDCLSGDQKALQEMLDYNIGDIELLEKVYEKMKPYIHLHPHVGVINDDKTACRRCGSENMKPRGYAYTNATKRQRWRCKDCGGWQ